MPKTSQEAGGGFEEGSKKWHCANVLGSSITHEGLEGRKSRVKRKLKLSEVPY